MEIITGVERRRRRVEDKLRIVAETEQAGACFAEIGRRYEISRGLLWNWRSKVRHGALPRLSAPSFLPVQVMTETLAAVPHPSGRPAPSSGVAVSDGRIEITLPDGLDNNVSLAACVG
jgi:transposase-like protein